MKNKKQESNMDKKEVKNLHTVINALEQMQKINGNMSLRGMLTFFTVKLLEYEEGQATVKQISQRLKTNSSAAGKLVKSHTFLTRHGTIGSGLLKTMEDPANRQSTRIQFTQKGNEALSAAIKPHKKRPHLGAKGDRGISILHYITV